MEDTKRILIAFAVVFLVLILWQFIFRQPASTRTETVPTDTTKKEVAAVPETTKPVVAHQPKLEKLTKPEIPEIEAVLENPELRIVFSNRGGTIKSVWLKKHQAELIPKGLAIFSNTMLTTEGQIDLSGLMMKTKATDSVIEYDLSLADGKIKKVWRLNHDYSLNLSIQLEDNAKGYLINIDNGIATTEKNIPDDLANFRFYTKAGKEFKGYNTKKIKNGLDLTEKLDWVGLRSKYFFIGLVALANKFDMTIVKPLPDNRIGFSIGTEQSLTNSYLVILSPLRYNLLRTYGMGLENAVELGWPKPFSLAILEILDFLYRIFRNYGVAIIIFSILMKAIFFPLTHSSTKQMRQMQLLQPKLEELKKKYKNDPQGLNRETMQLYKVYKINPLSGCLPLIIQMPIFWALYSVLRSTFDLRQANFVFWLKDLSLKDPYYVLPILMGVSFLFQSLLTSTDKRNLVLQIFMPIFMTVIFLNFPSGLQLYWFIYNILSIVESIIARKGGISWRKPQPQPQTRPLTSSPLK